MNQTCGDASGLWRSGEHANCGWWQHRYQHPV